MRRKAVAVFADSNGGSGVTSPQDIKAAIANYGHDPAWATVRPPLVELTTEQAKALVTELDQKTFTMPGLAAV